MSLYLFDTDSFTLFQFNHAGVVGRAAVVDRLAISIVTVDETLTGWYSRVRKAQTPAQLAVAYRGFQKSIEAIGVMEIVPYSEASIERQLELRKAMRRIGKLDLAIAAIALEFDATLVTRNRIDFEQIPGLQIEDWSQPKPQSVHQLPETIGFSNDEHSLQSPRLRSSENVPGRHRPRLHRPGARRDARPGRRRACQ